MCDSDRVDGISKIVLVYYSFSRFCRKYVHSRRLITSLAQRHWSVYLLRENKIGTGKRR
jgi:hypothetical protein